MFSICSVLDSSSATHPGPDNAAADDAAWHAPMLRELAEMGMEMARTVMAGARARAQAGEATAVDEATSTLALQRAAKLVRQTVALDMKRREPPKPAIPVTDQQQTLDEAAEARAKVEAESVWFRKRMWGLVGKPMARTAVALAIETEAEAPERERLLADLNEKLDAREAELADWGPGAYSDIIAGLIGELGLTGKAVDPYYPQKIAARARNAREAEANAAMVALRGAGRPAMAHAPP
jgi:hypothetical protein